MRLLLSIMISYYVSLLLHEWGHGTAAWLLGYKTTPFDVNYGGWLLLNVDENVPYDQILAMGHGLSAALIGIAGLLVSITLFILSCIALNKIKNGPWKYSLFYWFAIVNMVPIFQYFTVQAFSVEGDVGRFTHGLHLSPWWVCIPGTLFVCIALYQLCRHLIPKAYAVLSIKSLWGQRAFLLGSLVYLFLFLYIHRYNPFSDPGMPFIAKIFSLLSIFLVPILFFICNPSHKWVKKEIRLYRT